MATTFNPALADTTPTEMATSEPRTGLLLRMYNGLIASRERAAERAVERYIRANGGVLTDRIERDLSRDFGSIAGRRD